MKQLFLKIVKYSLPIIFIAYMGCISLFTHSHVVNGVTIVHSHPYNDDVEHSHTAAEFQLIDLLSTIHATDVAVSFFILAVILVLLCHLCSYSRNIYYPSPIWSKVSLRAPPFQI